MKLETVYYTAPDDVKLSVAHPGDSGYDLRATSVKIVGIDELGQLKENYPTSEPNILWEEIHYIEYDTMVCIEPKEPDTFCYLLPNSRITGKTNLVMGNSIGTIDNPYRGRLLDRFKYIMQPNDIHINEKGEILCKVNLSRIFKVGDVIGQMVFTKKIETQMEKVDKLTDTTRGSGGFGSTEKPTN